MGNKLPSLASRYNHLQSGDIYLKEIPLHFDHKDWITYNCLNKMENKITTVFAAY